MRYNCALGDFVMNKLVKDGQVAVLISPDFGGGWYSWNRDCPDMLTDAGLADLVLKGDLDQIKAYATLKWPDAYLGGVDSLTVVWIPQGTEIKIAEYDGSETIEYRWSDDWITV
jgi:hypothetical protein